MRPSDSSAFRADVTAGELVGYDVQALDGSIGEVDEATDELDASFIAVKTGPWIFGKRVILPAMVVERVDHDAAKVYVSRTKEEIKNAPEFDESHVTEAYQVELNRYYGSGRVGHNDPPRH